MAKAKTTVNDFMSLMDEENTSSEVAAFSPANGNHSLNGPDSASFQQASIEQLINSETDNKEITTHEPKLSQSETRPLVSREIGVRSTVEKALAEREQTVSNASSKALGKDEKTDQSTIGLQLDYKRTTNQRQSEDKVETQPRTQVGTNQRQSEDKVETPSNETRDILLKSRDKVETQPRTQVGTNQRQSEDKVETFAGFSSLVGLQRILIIFLYNSCKASRSYETEKLSIEHIAKSCETSVSSAKKTLQRLEQKSCFTRVKFKDGRGGWTIYELENSVFQDLLRAETEDKLGTKWGQSRDKVGTQLETQPRTTAPYSSSNNLNINTNTIELPENLRRFGISTVNLEKLVSSGKATQEVIERSLSALSFDVESGKTGNLANILFGVLGSGREYISQKYSETLQKELDLELSRIQQTEENQKRAIEIQLQAKFKAYLEENPTFIDSVRGRNRAFVKNDAVLEKVAFEEFKNIEFVK
jgi:CTP-dependent riboflavin kinase